MTESRLERKKNKTRQALLDTALALFARRGIYSPSIEEITEGADLGKGTFYKYFASREALIAALVGQGFDGLLQRVCLEIRGAKEGREVLTRVLQVHAAFFHDRPEYLLLFHQARGWLKLPGQAETPIRQEFDRYVGRIAEWIPPTDARGEQNRERQLRTALVLAGFISGVLSFQHILGGDSGVVSDLPGDIALLAGVVEM